jgi:uncharacterized iron-regulated protein
VIQTQIRVAFILILTLVCALTAARAELDLKIYDSRGRQRDIETVVTDISAARAVFIGENHDRYDQHLSELEIIRRLYERNPKRWTIGVEFIQRPFQADLDAYIAGEINEKEFLRRTEYFDRWGYDYRLYRPIFRFAKEHAISTVGLNATREVSEQVGKAGLEGLTGSLREQLPGEVNTSDQSYRKRIEKVFNQHREATGGNFQHFWEAQLVWDETMAERAAGYLSAHPEKAIIVLAGSGHVEFGSGIPSRVRRRLPGLNMTTLITADKPQTKSHLTDYSLVSKKEDLSPAPKMGLAMERSDGVRVKSVAPNGPAAKAGIMPKDRILRINTEEVKSVGDVRLALLDKRAGDRITMHVQRNNATATEDLTFELALEP